MNIFQRAPLDGVLVDVICWGRFYDFFEKRDGRWAIVRRQPIYEKDRLDPVDPSAALQLDQRRARDVSRRLPSPRLPAAQERLHREDRTARPARAGSREAVRGRQSLARRDRRRPASRSNSCHGAGAAYASQRTDRRFRHARFDDDFISSVSLRSALAPQLLRSATLRPIPGVTGTIVTDETTKDEKKAADKAAGCGARTRRDAGSTTRGRSADLKPGTTVVVIHATADRYVDRGHRSAED